MGTDAGVVEGIGDFLAGRSGGDGIWVRALLDGSSDGDDGEAEEAGEDLHCGEGVL